MTVEPELDQVREFIQQAHRGNNYHSVVRREQSRERLREEAPLHKRRSHSQKPRRKKSEKRRKTTQNNKDMSNADISRLETEQPSIS
jgi:hypothetical protein